MAEKYQQGREACDAKELPSRTEAHAAVGTENLKECVEDRERQSENDIIGLNRCERGRRIELNQAEGIPKLKKNFAAGVAEEECQDNKNIVRHSLEPRY